MTSNSEIVFGGVFPGLSVVPSNGIHRSVKGKHHRPGRQDRLAVLHAGLRTHETNRLSVKLKVGGELCDFDLDKNKVDKFDK